MDTYHITHDDIMEKAAGIASVLKDQDLNKIYPVPRGGVPAAYAVLYFHVAGTIVDNPEDADVILDDLVDSGATRQRYRETHPNKPFLTLYTKTGALANTWLVFPWEHTVYDSAADIPVRLLQYIGEDPSRGGLQETPQRVLKAWRHWTQGYGMDPAAILKCFEDGAERVNEMVVVKGIPMYSHCEHHMAPFFGRVHIGYVPNGRIVGLSKLSRLVKVFAQRLQVQERLTNQIADAMHDALAPLGVGVVVEARHLCMESRGICEQGHTTITSAMRGVLLDKAEARAEFLDLCRAP